jgi:hypothetical protein
MKKYFTAVELRELQYLRSMFPGCEIINPALHPELPRAVGIKYFHELINKCNALFFSEYLSTIDEDVFNEINYALHKKSIPVYLIRYNSKECQFNNFIIHPKCLINIYEITQSYVRYGKVVAAK